ncbi:putative cytochrome c assembly protein, transmembrane domain [Candidatus Terasakiella magnetica]|uniref:Putative cytochrome c assembly protein, transmembrane domain n=1 Tax=Candidatus Terasakiella magnetica TaxID=1867952 RepID=A0A1C3RJM5_9PROT|nr:cytochrome c biogenesis CcdA family protein [Candidatus Terasakiella magnetica]SCA57468.1 putative cytochrome c assembly protein, transmembrane domain [Candidatus Terasakiella magnetica]
MAMDVSFLAAFSAGLLTFLSPCILPLVPAYLCFISGNSLEQLTSKETQQDFNRKNVLWAGFAFVLGLSSIFIAMGAAATSLGQVIAQHKQTLAMVGGGIIVVFGLHYMGLFKIAFLNFEKRFHPDQKPAGLIGAFVLGLAFGFGWTPCVGPVLSTILMVAGGMGELSDGIILLAIYAAGLGIPFMLAAALSAHFMSFLARFRKHLHKVEIAMGGLLVLTGTLMLTGSLTDITGWLLETFPVLNGLN